MPPEAVGEPPSCVLSAEQLNNVLSNPAFAVGFVATTIVEEPVIKALQPVVPLIAFTVYIPGNV